jgi:Leucine-rich repeat (LRR) protein
MKTKLLFIVLFFIFFKNALAQTTPIPDTNFEQALIDLGFDTNGLNGTILQVDAEAIDSLKIGNPLENTLTPNVGSKITNISGIEGMLNLKYLDVRKNEIAIADISQNIKIEALHISDNFLTALDISKLTELTYINMGRNQLTNVDFTNNTKLETLFANSNQLEDLEILNLPTLKRLQAVKNKISSINLSNNTILEYILIERIPRRLRRV